LIHFYKRKYKMGDDKTAEVEPSSLDEKNVREVGNQATWSLSSCKPGFGVEQLRDDSLETYWQVN